MAIQTQLVSSNPWGYYHTSNTASPPTTSKASVDQILVLSTNQCYSPQGIKTPMEEGSLFNIRI